MNPTHTWHSETFRAYCIILLSLLAVAGALLAVASGVFKKNVVSVWLTYRSWVVMIPIGMGAVLLGRATTITLFVLLSIFAFKEFARATGLYKDWWMTGTAYLAIIALGVTAWLSPQENRLQHVSSMPIFVVPVIMAIPIIRNQTHEQLQAMALALSGFICIGWMFLHILLLVSATTLGLLLFLVTAVELSDVAAFCSGKLIGNSGRHPLRSRISPSKTWEGAIGGFCMAMALPWLLRFSLPRFGTVQLLATGVIVGIGGQLGDLAISAIKRDLGVKDMGTAIPGHGGLLDRIDSLIVAAPLFVHMTNCFVQ
jgi:phosphatidate cytidylyltransferase